MRDASSFGILGMSNVSKSKPAYIPPRYGTPVPRMLGPYMAMTSMVRLSNAIKVTPTALSHSYCIILIDSSTRLLPHATSHGASCAPADSVNLLFKALAAFIDYATAREVGFSISVPLYCGDPAAHSQSGSTQPEDSRIKNYGMLTPVVCSK